MTCWGRIRYLMRAGRDTFTTSSFSAVNAVNFNFLIWHFTIIEAVLRFPPTSVFTETTSLERLPPKAEKNFLPMRQSIPGRTPTRYFKVLLLLLYYFITIIFINNINYIWFSLFSPRYCYLKFRFYCKTHSKYSHMVWEVRATKDNIPFIAKLQAVGSDVWTFPKWEFYHEDAFLRVFITSFTFF